MTPPFLTTLLFAALAAAGTAAAPAAPAAAADHDHHACPSGYEAKEAESRDERAKDRNGDGIVCVRETDDGTQIRDDTHDH